MPSWYRKAWSEWFHAFDNQVAPQDRVDLYATEKYVYLNESNLELMKLFENFNEHTENYVSYVNFRFANASIKLDLYQRRSPKYWSTHRECGARAFEWYVIEKLKEKGYTNEYLAQIPEMDWGHEDMFPYPHPNDQWLITQIFDGIFQNVKQVAIDGSNFKTIR